MAIRHSASNEARNRSSVFLGVFQEVSDLLAATPIYAGVCLALGVTGAVHAQQGGGQAVEEITITGSRIVRRDLNAPSPILTLDVSAFEQSSAIALETVLNQYPQFSPGTTQFTAGQNQPTADTSPGASTLNMRGLGAGRALVLVDGRRAQPINAALAVDINTIPSAMIESVEVITGGAAATYGPDAMVGVVNFKLKTNFQGLKVNYQTGFTDAGDGEERRFDVLMGGNFEDGRGNAVLSLGWAGRDAALQENRDFFVDGWKDPGTEANYPRVSFPLWTPGLDQSAFASRRQRGVPGPCRPDRSARARLLSISTTTAASSVCRAMRRRRVTRVPRSFRTRSAKPGRCRRRRRAATCRARCRATRRSPTRVTTSRTIFACSRKAPSSPPTWRSCSCRSMRRR